MFSREKYIYRILELAGLYAIIILGGTAIGAIHNNILMGLGASALISGAVLVPLIIYYVYYYFKTKALADTAERREGVVSNWRMSEMSRDKAYLLIKDGDKEYETSSVFTRDDAPDYVGQRVSFAMLHDVAVIFKMLKEDSNESKE